MENTHTHTRTRGVPRDAQGEWSPFGQGLGAILTNVGVAHTLIKLMGYEHREDAVLGGGAGNDKHTHTVSHVIHRVDGASANNPTLS